MGPDGLKRARPAVVRLASGSYASVAMSAADQIGAERARQIRRWLEDRNSLLVDLLERLVRLESPSDNKAALDRCAAELARQWRRLGFSVRVIRQRQAGNHLLARLPGLTRARPILLLGHYDTVHPLGTLQRAPFRRERGRARGPGALDMKGGWVIALGAAAALRALHLRPARPLLALATADEEIGSPSSRRLIERLARHCAAVLVLEPAAAGGALKTARKGTGEIELIVHGRAAHAGLHPERGVNAIHELALQIGRLLRLNTHARGLTLNAGVIEGGTRPNVIPDRARTVMDFRVARMADARALERQLAGLQPILPGARLEVRGGLNRPPMERTQSRALFTHARRLGRLLGLELEEATVGGGSDGNFTAALGIPTLDGLGAVGDGAHTLEEYVQVRSLPQRAALLALLLASPLPVE